MPEIALIYIMGRLMGRLMGRPNDVKKGIETHPIMIN